MINRQPWNRQSLLLAFTAPTIYTVFPTVSFGRRIEDQTRLPGDWIYQKSRCGTMSVPVIKKLDETVVNRLAHNFDAR
jgi:hypothetical protein